MMRIFIMIKKRCRDAELLAVSCQQSAFSFFRRLRFDNTGRTGRGGFTIVELLAVVLVIGLLASMVGGRYVGSYRKGQAAKAARELVLACQYGRMVALEYQRVCKLKMDRETKQFYLTIFQYDELTGQFDEQLIQNWYSKPVTLEGDVSFQDIQVTRGGHVVRDSEAVHFFANGSSEGALIRVGDDRFTYTVKVSAGTGRVSMHEGAPEFAAEVLDLDG